MDLGRRPGDPRRAIERASPADRLASRLRIAGSTNTEARWREEAATSCWEPPSAGSVPSRARRRGGVAPRSDVRRCCRRTTARRRASCIRLRRGDHRSRGRSESLGARERTAGERHPMSIENGSGGTDARQHGQAEAPGRDRAQARGSRRAPGRPRGRGGGAGGGKDREAGLIAPGPPIGPAEQSEFLVVEPEGDGEAAEAKDASGSKPSKPSEPKAPEPAGSDARSEAEAGGGPGA